MTTREKLTGTLSYQTPCLFHHEIGLLWAWEETKERWRSEGWDGTPFEQLFSLDPLPRVPVNYGPSPEFEVEIITEDSDFRTYQNEDGVVVREPKLHASSFMPEFLHYPVETLGDFKKFRLERLDTSFEARCMEGEAVGFKKYDHIEKQHRWQRWIADSPKRTEPTFCFTARWGGYFGPFRTLLGWEKACLAFYDEPALVEEFMEERTYNIIRLTKAILDKTDFDMFGFWEDMAGKNGPLISPELFKKFALPHYRKVCDFLYSRGVKYIFVDSDGDARRLIPLWLEAGINGIFPCEVAAGMDVVKIRHEYGKRLLLFGGVNKRALEGDKREIIAEIDRITPLVEEGGYLPCFDHSAHAAITWDNMCFYVEELQRRFGEK